MGFIVKYFHKIICYFIQCIVQDITWYASNTEMGSRSPFLSLEISSFMAYDNICFRWSVSSSPSTSNLAFIPSILFCNFIRFVWINFLYSSFYVYEIINILHNRIGDSFYLSIAKNYLPLTVLTHMILQHKRICQIKRSLSNTDELLGPFCCTRYIDVTYRKARIFYLVSSKIN